MNTHIKNVYIHIYIHILNYVHVLHELMYLYVYKKISRGCDNHTFQFMSDVNRYYQQIKRRTVDHKEGNEFSAVSFYRFV